MGSVTAPFVNGTTNPTNAQEQPARLVKVERFGGVVAVPVLITQAEVLSAQERICVE